MALCVVLGVIGAILKYAVNVSTTGFNINTVGLILLIAGIVVFVIAAAVLAMGSSRRSTVREDIRETPTGASRIEERDDRGVA
jgi:hypothetical protein